MLMMQVRRKMEDIRVAHDDARIGERTDLTIRKADLWEHRRLACTSRFEKNAVVDGSRCKTLAAKADIFKVKSGASGDDIR